MLAHTHRFNLNLKKGETGHKLGSPWQAAQELAFSRLNKVLTHRWSMKGSCPQPPNPGPPAVP